MLVKSGLVFELVEAFVSMKFSLKELRQKYRPLSFECFLLLNAIRNKESSVNIVKGGSCKDARGFSRDLKLCVVFLVQAEYCSRTYLSKILGIGGRMTIAKWEKRFNKNGDLPMIKKTKSSLEEQFEAVKKIPDEEKTPEQFKFERDVYHAMCEVISGETITLFGGSFSPSKKKRKNPKAKTKKK
jgi:transposase